MIAEYLLLGSVSLLLGLLATAMCLSCRKHRKSYENDGSLERPSVSDETEHIVPNIVLPPKTNERNKASTSSVSTTFASTADEITPCPASPPACRSGGATVDDSDFDDDLNSSFLGCPLYVESYPLCRPDPSTQFLMDSCEDSVEDALSTLFVDCDENESGDNPYDFPLYDDPSSLKKSSGASSTSRLKPTFETADVIVHPEPTPWKKARSATIHTEYPSSSVWPSGDELEDDVKDGNVYEELGAVDADSDVYKNKNFLSDVVLAPTAGGQNGTKKKIMKSSRTVSVSHTLPARSQDGPCPPPCTGPEYVNFKGRLRSWKPPPDDQ